MPKFRKKPVVIEATQWFKYGDHPEVIKNFLHPHNNPCIQCRKKLKDHGRINTLEGNHIVCPGDWIITGVAGEKYPCKPDIFQETYEKVEGK